MTHNLSSRRRKKRERIVILLVAVIILFAILVPIIPTAGAGGYGGGHPQILGSISYVLTRGNFGFTYWNGGYYFGGPPIP